MNGCARVPSTDAGSTARVGGASAASCETQTSSRFRINLSARASRRVALSFFPDTRRCGTFRSARLASFPCRSRARARPTSGPGLGNGLLDRAPAGALTAAASGTSMSRAMRTSDRRSTPGSHSKSSERVDAPVRASCVGFEPHHRLRGGCLLLTRLAAGFSPWLARGANE